MNETFLVFLLGHLLADYTLQSESLALSKRSSRKSLLLHLVIMAVIYLVLALIFKIDWFVISLIIASHLLIDFIKYFLDGKVDERYLYTIDQVAHLLILWLIAHYYPINMLGLGLYVRWLVLILLVSKPANVTFKIFFKRYYQVDSSETISGAGALIGTIERLIMLVFISLGEYASMGLILTAKSIARFDKISKDQMFAEYYLLGSLFSVLWVLLTSFIIL